MRRKETSNPVTFLPGIQYDGPEIYAPAKTKKKYQCRPLWDEFTRRLTNNGQYTHTVDTLNKLNELAFTDISAKDFLEKYAPNAVDKQPPGDDPAYKALKQDMETIALISSEDSVDGKKRPLNTVLVDNLMRKWAGVERSFGLYPPKSIATKKGVKGNKQDIIIEKRHTCLSSAQGALLSGLLRAANEKIIYTNKIDLYADCRRLNITRDAASDIVENNFENALFCWKISKGASLKTLIKGSNTFAHHKLHAQGKKNLLSSIHSHPSLDHMTDMAQENPRDFLIEAERKASLHSKVRELVRQIPDSRHRKIIADHFGLDISGANKDSATPKITREIQEIAAELGMNRKYVSKLKTDTLRNLEAEAEKLGLGQNSDPRNRTRQEIKPRNIRSHLEEPSAPPKSPCR